MRQNSSRFSIQQMLEMSSDLESFVGMEKVVNVNDDYATELHLAVKDNNIQAIRKFLMRGVKVNAPDKFGRTPLHWAVVYGHQEAAKSLIVNTNKRALDTRDSCGCTALHYAAMAGRTEVGRILIQRGADVNCMDSRKRTPLHFAAQHPRPGMVEMLVSRGADKFSRDVREYLPCDVAIEWASFSSLGCLRLDSQKKDPTLKVHPVDSEDEQDGREGTPVEVAVRKGPSLDKLLESWKKAENETKRKKEAESEVAAKAFLELQRRLDDWRVAERDAKLTEREDRRPMLVDDRGDDAILQVKEKRCHPVLYPRYSSSSGSASLPSCSQSMSSFHPEAVRDCSLSVECIDNESCYSLSSFLLPSASSSCQEDPGSPPNIHDWLEQNRRKVGPKEALLFCTEWEVELPCQSPETEVLNCEDAIYTPPTSPRQRKGKEKAVEDEESPWVQVWPKPSSSPSRTTSLSPGSKTDSSL